MAVVVGGGAGETAAGIAIASNSGCFSSTAVAIPITWRASCKKTETTLEQGNFIQKNSKTHTQTGGGGEYGKFVKINKKYFSKWKNRLFEFTMSRGPAGRKCKTVPPRNASRNTRFSQKSWSESGR